MSKKAVVRGGVIPPWEGNPSPPLCTTNVLDTQCTSITWLKECGMCWCTIGLFVWPASHIAQGLTITWPGGHWLCVVGTIYLGVTRESRFLFSSSVFCGRLNLRWMALSIVRMYKIGVYAYSQVTIDCGLMISYIGCVDILTDQCFHFH